MPGRRTEPRLMRRVADLVSAVLRQAGLKPANDNWRVAEAWVRTVGDRVARHAEPLRLEGTELVVAVDDAVWRQELALLAPEIVARLNAEIGNEIVRRLRLVSGRPASPAPPAPIGPRWRSFANIEGDDVAADEPAPPQAEPEGGTVPSTAASDSVQATLARLRTSMQARIRRDTARARSTGRTPF